MTISSDAVLNIALCSIESIVHVVRDQLYATFPGQCHDRGPIDCRFLIWIV